MQQLDTTDRSSYIMLGMLLGAAAGVVTGVLTAPKAGKETRSELKLRASTTKDRAQKELTSQKEMFGEKLNKTLDRSKRIANNVSSSAKETINKTAERAKQATDKAEAQDAFQTPTV